MEFEEIVQKFIDKSFYLSNGAGLLSDRWKVSKEIIKSAKKIARDRLANIEDYGTEYNPEDVAFKNNKISEPKGKLLKRWGKEGNWSESYSFANEVDEDFDIDKVLSNMDLSSINPTYFSGLFVSKQVLNLYLSDQHIGASVSNGLYTNYFDDEVYSGRMKEVTAFINEKASIFGGFAKINVLFLGDTFDGQDGYTVKRTHHLPQNMSNNEAFEIGVKVNMQFFDDLVSVGFINNISVYCVSDSNHGGSMDFYLFKALQEIIKYKYPEIKFTIATKFIDYFTEGIHTFMYTHGKDGKDMKFGLPIDLNDKTENFINQYIDNYEINNKSIHFIKGDLHRDALSTGKKFRYRNVPSLFGSSGWIMKNFGNTKPGVGYDIFNPDEDNLMSGVIKFKT